MTGNRTKLFVRLDIRIEKIDSAAVASKIARLVAELSFIRVVGWIRIMGDHMGARLYCLRRQEERIQHLLLENFGEAAVVEPLTLVESPPPGLEQLHVVEGRKDKRKTAAIHLERVDHRGGLAGWAYADPAPADGAINVAIDIDGEPQDTVPAERFRPDLLKLGFGTGECAFNFMIPHKYLDGQRHLDGSKNLPKSAEF